MFEVSRRSFRFQARARHPSARRLLRQTGGFERLHPSGEPFGPEQFAVAVRIHSPVAELEIRAARLAACLATNVGDDPVRARVDDLCQFARATFPCGGCHLLIERPERFSASNWRLLWPFP